MTRFNRTALQEQGMTPDEINAYIAERERAMYGGPGNSSAPTTQSESFNTYDATFTAAPLTNQSESFNTKDATFTAAPLTKNPSLGIESSTSGPRSAEPSESSGFQTLLNDVKEKTKRPDTPAVVQKEEPETLANFQAILEKLQGG